MIKLNGRLLAQRGITENSYMRFLYMYYVCLQCLPYDLHSSAAPKPLVAGHYFFCQFAIEPLDWPMRVIV